MRTCNIRPYAHSYTTKKGHTKLLLAQIDKKNVKKPKKRIFYDVKIRYAGVRRCFLW